MSHALCMMYVYFFYLFYVFFSQFPPPLCYHHICLGVHLVPGLQEASGGVGGAAGENRHSELEEATLLKDWDFAKFFPSKFLEDRNKRNSEQSERKDSNKNLMQRQSQIDMEALKNKYKDNITQSSRSKPVPKSDTKEKLASVFNLHRRQESDSKVSNPFFRGFRRENSDLFPLSSTRHSAIYISKNEGVPAAQVNPLRSSGIFNNNRRPARGEPILTDFIKMNDSLKMSRQGEINKSITNQKNNNKITEEDNTLKNIGLLDGGDDTGSTENAGDNSPTASIASSIAFAPPRTEGEAPVLRKPSEFIAEYLRRPQRREKTESDIVYRNSALMRDPSALQVTHQLRCRLV